ncbi:hypothetical protein [Salinigranum halophilum]|uniref:hypothetical protein n=1 Tax=Salinigranum halophilum TaxID=2565931 RepID=UPI0013757216|nr:hypothetical protein [Salinigranum halophilum]
MANEYDAITAIAKSNMVEIAALATVGVIVVSHRKRTQSLPDSRDESGSGNEQTPVDIDAD